MKKAATKEVAVKEESKVAVATVEQSELMSEWGYQDLDSSDIKIPKILLMQGLSERVTNGDAQMGDLVDSISGDILGSAREKDYSPIEIIPIDMFKTWTIQEILGPGKFEYVKTVPESIETSAWRKEYEYEENGRKYKRVHNLNFYVLLKKDIGNPLAMPYVITFRSTSYTVGTVMSNHFANCLRAKQKGIFMIPPSFTFELGGELIKDEHTYYKYSLNQSNKTPEEGILEAVSWFKTIKATKNVIVDNSDEGAAPIKDVGATSEELDV